MTVYLLGILQRRFTGKDTYGYMKAHWLSWFPQLPSYQRYNHRINQLHRRAAPWHLEVVVSDLMSKLSFQDCYPDGCLTDSLPIILPKRPYQAKVALGVAHKGYCSTKKLYYHGLKFHFLGPDRYQRMPIPEHLQVTPASAFNRFASPAKPHDCGWFIS